MKPSKFLLATLAVVSVCAVALYRTYYALPRLPSGFPALVIPADNPLTRDKAALGRVLFYDRRLSFNETVSCADCHQQRHGFADPRPLSVGATGEFTRRNAMSLTNVAYNSRYTWADDRVLSLEDQANIPLTLEHPVEMGFQRAPQVILDRFGNDPGVRELFRKAFPRDPSPVSLLHIVQAISTFERLLLSGKSPYDRYWAGDNKALSDDAIRGLALFKSSRVKCANCHGGFNFRFTLGHRQGDDVTVAYHNTGLYNLDGSGAYPPSDRGLFEVTGRAEDMGRFKAPTLRNISVTAPYMHDGSIATLSEVIDHYARGGRRIESGAYVGDGSTNPHKSPLVAGFALSEGDKRDLIAFLNSLTDEHFLSDPNLAAPTDPPR